MGYKGFIVELPIGTDGFTGTKNLAQTQPTQLIQAMNIDYAGGSMRKEGGSTKYNSTPITGNTAILSGYDWNPDTIGTQRMVVYTDAGKLLKDTGGGDFAVTLKSSLDTSALGVFVEAGSEEAANNKKLFFFNGVDAPQVLSGDGATTSDIGATGVTAPTAPTVALAGAGAGNLDTSVVYTYKITYVNANGETTVGTVSSNITPTGGDGQVSLTSIPVSSHGSVSSRKIYRTEGGGATYKLLATLSDNTTTVYTDNIADGSLGAIPPATNGAGTQPSDWTGSNQPTLGVNHEARLWAAGNANDPHRFYYSDTSNHEDITSSMPIFPGEGEKIVAALSYKGYLIVWKFPLGIYAIDTTAVDAADWKVVRLNKSTGGVSPLCAVAVDDDILFLDNSGNFQLLSAVQEFGDVSARNLSKESDMDVWIHENINFSKLDKCQAVWYPKKREARFALTKSGSANNDMQVVIDFNRPNLQRFRFSDQNDCVSIWIRKESDNTFLPLVGDSNGYVWKLDQEARTKDTSTGYEGKFQTAHDDFNWFDKSLSAKRKRGQFLELILEPKGSYDLDVDVFWDGSYEDTYQFNMGYSGVGLGSFTLGTDVLGGADVLNRKKRITGGGKRFSLLARNDTNAQDFNISKFLLYIIPGDEKIEVE
tara:strand:+ start:927 stop:2873 length:1947 start_codon:yes stop_codon:yes gene_type:complete